MSVMKVWGLVMIIMVMAIMGDGDANSTCKKALNYLSPCKEFILNVTEYIPDGCCEGCLSLERLVRNLKKKRKQKIELCKCLQKDGTQSGADAAKALQLIQTCNVTYAPIYTGPDVNCTKIFNSSRFIS